MGPVSAPPSPERHRPSFRSRALSFLLTLVVEGLLLWMLLHLAVGPLGQPKQDNRPILVDLLPGQKPKPESKRAIEQASRGGRDRPSRSPTRVEAVLVPHPEEPPPPLKMIILTREEFAAADIAKMPSHRGAGASDDQGAADANAGQGDGSGTFGTGPNGQPLYKAEWYRPPTDAELAFYLPRGMSERGWGEIVCQTVPDYRVDNCQEFGQSPGSGLARAVREAAWQFRVRPPRIGGRSMVGTWVRIRIDYSQKGAHAG